MRDGVEEPVAVRDGVGERVAVRDSVGERVAVRDGDADVPASASAQTHAAQRARRGI